MQTSESITVKVWRGNADGGQFADYEVPHRPAQTILDVVTWIQRHADPGLAYRFACRVGMCGSCAMTVNGSPRWTCRTHVNKVIDGNRLTIEPLRNLPVIKDLACDMSAFFDKWNRAEGRFVGTATREHPVAAISPREPARRAADAAIECINCGICYAACDQVGWQSDYLGPAALNRAWSLQNDSRDRNHATRLRAVTVAGGCQQCHSQQGCAAHCPNELNPTASIAGLKRMATAGFFGFARQLDD
ncbi:MAG TPA: 2Fe-2S iron-sulfur cluster-binding protein [Gammaproteobacteria bacterium]|nr:2Fe-2S iron-sulfur cluster-binding protein [Gammaproteobacteria bacterium]